MTACTVAFTVKPGRSHRGRFSRGGFVCHVGPQHIRVVCHDREGRLLTEPGFLPWTAENIARALVYQATAEFQCRPRDLMVVGRGRLFP